jgi:peptidyl-prolyl cis-trans isomerase A (cyclophilin A)
LLHPDAKEQAAPERFTVLLETTVGELHLDVRRSWAPHSADRLYTLVKLRYFDGLAFFRVVKGLVAQIGIHSDPAIERVWRDRRIADDRVVQTNNRGMVSFVPDGSRGRATQIVIDLADNERLDRQGFAPLGRVREIDLTQRLFSGYGDVSPIGRGPSPSRIQREGRSYLEAQFGNLDYLKQALITGEIPTRPAITP